MMYQWIMQTDRSTIAAKPPTTRSRITNGRDLVAGADGRSAAARRYRDLMAQMIDDLGGDATVSEVQRQLVRRAAGLMIQGEATEARIINGETVDIGAHVTACNALRRITDTLGLKRAAKREPTLSEAMERAAANRRGAAA
jgi:hypothetical protein